jgi:hypothetical protein
MHKRDLSLSSYLIPAGTYLFDRYASATVMGVLNHSSPFDRLSELNFQLFHLISTLNQQKIMFSRFLIFENSRPFTNSIFWVLQKGFAALFADSILWRLGNFYEKQPHVKVLMLSVYWCNSNLSQYINGEDRANRANRAEIILETKNLLQIWISIWASASSDVSVRVCEVTFEMRHYHL